MVKNPQYTNVFLVDTGFIFKSMVLLIAKSIDFLAIKFYTYIVNRYFKGGKNIWTKWQMSLDVLVRGVDKTSIYLQLKMRSKLSCL